MTRSRASARKAGSWFESQTRDTFKAAFPDLEIHKAPRWGAKDQGDLTGVKFERVECVTFTVTCLAVDSRLAVECKNVHQLSLPSALKEAKVEAVNAGADLGIVVHKRHGSTNPMEQMVTLEMGDFLKILGVKAP